MMKARLRTEKKARKDQRFERHYNKVHHRFEDKIVARGQNKSEGTLQEDRNTTFSLNQSPVTKISPYTIIENRD